MSKERIATVERTSSETNIRIRFGLSSSATINILTSIPFLSHMLHSFAFHGGFLLDINAKGDVDVDPHHLVEDTALTLGTCIRNIVNENTCIRRFAWARVPMDDALCEAVIDISNRPYCVYDVDFSGDEYAGTFSLNLLQEFFTAMSNNAAMNLHLHAVHGHNGHHIAEALFKATALALSTALEEGKQNTPSTKGLI